MVNLHDASALTEIDFTVEAMKSLGARVKQLRLDAGLTQAEVASRVGVTKSAITQLEKGQIRDPKPVHLMKLARLFGLSAEDLVFGGSNAQPPKPPPAQEAHAAYSRSIDGNPMLPAEYELIMYLRRLGKTPVERSSLARRALLLVSAHIVEPVMDDDQRLVAWSAKNKKEKED